MNLKAVSHHVGFETMLIYIYWRTAFNSIKFWTGLCRRKICQWQESRILNSSVGYCHHFIITAASPKSFIKTWQGQQVCSVNIMIDADIWPPPRSDKNDRQILQDSGEADTMILLKAEDLMYNSEGCGSSKFKGGPPSNLSLPPSHSIFFLLNLIFSNA